MKAGSSSNVPIFIDAAEVFPEHFSILNQTNNIRVRPLQGRIALGDREVREASEFTGSAKIPCCRPD